MASHPVHALFDPHKVPHINGGRWVLQRGGLNSIEIRARGYIQIPQLHFMPPSCREIYLRSGHQSPSRDIHDVYLHLCRPWKIKDQVGGMMERIWIIGVSS